MQFPGWWVEGDDRGVTITPATFDETELSEESEWKEAHQNAENEGPHGFIEWDQAVADAQQRLQSGTNQL